MTLGQQLRLAIETSGQSTQALAQATELTAREIDDLRRGEDVKLSVAEKVAAHLGLELLPRAAEELAAQNPATVRQAARSLAQKVGTNLHPAAPKPLN